MKKRIRIMEIAGFIFLMFFGTSVLAAPPAGVPGEGSVLYAAQPRRPGPVIYRYNTSRGVLSLELKGATVIGNYPYKGGKIQGVLSGNIVKGTWRQQDGWGQFQFTFMNQFRNFRGVWKFANEPRWRQGWDGTLMP